MYFRKQEQYVRPVGFGTEPREEVRRWIGRIITLGFVALIAWIAWARVINPPPA